MSALRTVTVPVTPIRQNCTVLWDEASKAAWVVDPGGEVPRIMDVVAEHGLKVERILLTHGHFDHAGGADELRGELPGVPVDGPDERDAFLLEAVEQHATSFGIAGARNVRPDRWLREGDELSLAGHRFQVLHCPGHSPGHVVFAAADDRLALVGDVLFHGSVGRTDFPYCDTAALLGAIRDKLLPLGDDMAFLCGHGPGSTIGEERRSNPFVRQAIGLR